MSDVCTSCGQVILCAGCGRPFEGYGAVTTFSDRHRVTKRYCLSDTRKCYSNVVGYS